MDDANRERLADAITAMDVEWTAVDGVSAQERSGLITVPYPRHWADEAGVEHTSTVTAVLHTPTNAMLFLPPGVSIEEFKSIVSALI